MMPASHLVVAKRHLHGTHRSESLVPTLDRVLKVAAQAGITRISNVTGLDRVGIPVVMAVRPASKTLSVWQGKSDTLIGAKISGAMEAIETACAESPPQAAERAAAADLGRLVPSTLFARSHAARAMRHESLEWLNGYDLRTRKIVYVPRQLAALAGVSGATPFFADPGTNGLAAGNDAV